MSTNLVSLVMQFLTPDMIQRIASALGVDKAMIGKALGAAVPTLLGGLMNMASTPEGSRKLNDTISQQQPGMLDGLAGMLGGAGQKSLIDNGSGMLTALLGGASSSALGSAIGKFAGLDSGTSSSLMGLLAPMVLGTLGKQKAAGGLDAAGLAQLLASNKSNIAGALPSGFANLLGGSGLLNNLGNLGDLGTGAVKTAAAAAQTAASTAASTATATAQRAVEASGRPGWLKWALALAALVAIAWWFFGSSFTSRVDQAKDAATQAVRSGQNLLAGSVDLGASVQNAITSVRQTLQGVTDATMAKNATQKLQEANAEFDKVMGLLDKLPAGGKSALAALITAARPALDELFNKVLAIPGASDALKPAIDAMRAKLDTMAKASG